MITERLSLSAFIASALFRTLIEISLPSKSTPKRWDYLSVCMLWSLMIATVQGYWNKKLHIEPIAVWSALGPLRPYWPVTMTFD